MDVATFLSRYPPFDALTDEALAAAVRATEIEHFTAGTTILEESGDPAKFLYVIRKGAVELLSQGQLYDLLGEGDVFGQFSLLAEASPTATVRAHEDTLCYLVDAAVADEILGTSAGRMFVIGKMRERLAAGYDVIATPPGAPYRPVGHLVRREAVAADASMTITDAARRMTEERVSSLLVPMRGGWGIVTDRDLRSRALAAGRDVGDPVEEIATFPVTTFAHDALVGEALLAMFAEGVHHFPVTDAEGRIVGVVTDTDLMDIGRHTPFAIRSGIERARTRDDAIAAGRELPEVVIALVDAGAEPVGIGRVVGLVVDALTRRLLDLAMTEFGEPPVPWAWLALGSAARHEQALHTDQDHALAYDPQGRPPEELDAVFGPIATFVTAGLDDAGIPRCRGDVMASNPAMRRSIDDWVAAFRTWMQDLSLTGSTQSSIVYDFRQVAGDLDAVTPLEEVILQARTEGHFIRHLARRALDERPPTGFLRDLVVQRKGEHVGTLDVKHGGITTIGNIARAQAVRAGVSAKGTLDRLRGAEEAGVLDAESARELREAFRFLWEVRLQHQVRQVRDGEPPDDFVDPSTLGPVARRGLKESFHVIARAQRTLATEFGVRMP